MSALNTLNGRLATFKKNGWPHLKSTSYCATPESLAAAGFYHRPFPGSEDNVACFLCNKNLDGWESTDEAWNEHVKHAAHCSLVRLDTEAGRMATFTGVSHWPHGQSLSAQKMSRAGFFYWPKLMPSKAGVMMDDTAVCFQCGLALDGWEEGDDPHNEHAKRRPDCPFVKKGIALHPCSFEFLLGSKPDINAIRHISSSSAVATKDASTDKFKLPPPRKETKKVADTMGVERHEGLEKPKTIKKDKVPEIQKKGALPPPSASKSSVPKRSPKNSAIQTTKPANDLAASSTAHPSLAVVTVATPGAPRQSMRRLTAVSTKTPSAAPLNTSAMGDTDKQSHVDLYDKENEPPTTSKHRKITIAKPIAIADETAALLGVTTQQASLMTVEDYIAILQARKLEEFETKSKELLAKFSKSAFV